ncbi:oxidoreductase [Xylaria venustula]|nr:oxidoreductase [Xylaria venustula]
MSPVRVGIVGMKSRPAGLSEDQLSRVPGLWAGNAHLPSLLYMPQDYEVVAVCNSSIESANKAIETFGLKESVKAYANPDDLSNDPNIDLVVISVNVGKHLELAKPALLKKKDLTRLAQSAGVRTSVGVQARADPLIVKVKEIVESGQIGQVRNSSALIGSSLLPGSAWAEGGEYYLNWKSGGNEFIIFIGHFLDSFIHVLGDFAEIQAIMKSAITEIPIVNRKGEVVNPAYHKTAPEHVLIQGILESGALASISSRKSKNEVDDVSFRWIISGTEGEIEILVPQFSWQMGHPARTLKLRVGTNDAENVDFIGKDKFESNVPVLAANVARQYAALAKGDTNAFADFGSALRTHVLLDRITQAAGWERV